MGFDLWRWDVWNLSDGHAATVFASETCAFDLIGATYIGDVEPGEMVIVGPKGITRELYTTPEAPAHCAFEHVYFSRPDSIVFGKSVAQSRELMGRLLAREHPVEADRRRSSARFGSSAPP